MPNRPDITTAPIPQLIKALAIPASVGFFFNTMYNVVDTYFSGLISTQALASLSLSFPIFFSIIALGTGIATGSTALIATALGARQTEEAKHLACQGVSFGVVMSIGLSAAGILLAPSLFRILGASDAYLYTALSYMTTIFGGTVFFMLIYMLNSVLNAQGDTRPYRNFLILGFFMNVILDPWFIYGGLGLPAMGIVGVALATVLVQVAGCFYLGYKVHQSGLICHISLRDLLPNPARYKEIARQGLPASMNMLTVGIGIFVITYFLSRFGKEGVAAYGVAVRIEQIVLLPTIGLNIATLTITAQNNGAGRFDRVYEVLRTALKYGAVVSAVAAIPVLVLARHLMGLFTQDPTVIAYGTTYLRIMAFLLYAYVALFIYVSALQGIKRPMYAIWIGLYRQIIGAALLFYLFSQVLSWGVSGVWLGIFCINWSAALFTWWYARRILHRKIGPPQPRGEA